MTIINICSLVSVLLMVSMLVFIGCSMDRLNNKIQDLADNQFDAEQVMNIYEQKFRRPIITQDRVDIKELMFEDRIPWEVYKRMGTDEELHAKLLEQISKQYADMIIPYIDIAITSDYFRNDEVVKARLRVVSK